MYLSPSSVTTWITANTRPRRLVNWCKSKAVKAPGQMRATLLPIISPLAIENQSSAKDVKALARDRYQNTLGSAPARDAARDGTHRGIVKNATPVPMTAPTYIATPHPDRVSCLAGALLSIPVAPN